jgi:hypothetical protein
VFINLETVGEVKVGRRKSQNVCQNGRNGKSAQTVTEESKIVGKGIGKTEHAK